MKFSVVGLPHYTIWHLYEPSVDDLRHMEEMEKEKKDKEAKEKAEHEKIEKIKSQFDNPKQQWEQDKTTFEDIAHKASEAYAKKLATQKDTKSGSQQKNKVAQNANKIPEGAKRGKVTEDQV